MQDGQSGPSNQRICSRWQGIRPASQAEIGGKLWISWKIEADNQWYEHAHHKPMGLKAIARMIQTMLYAKRFFPYYVYNILGGIEEDGKLLPTFRAA
jgi:hypothetical protein